MNDTSRHESRNHSETQRPDQPAKQSDRCALLRSRFSLVLLFLLVAPLVLAENTVYIDGNFKVENDQSELKTETTVKTIEYRPKTSMYFLRGKVRYNDVEGDAYLEMWNGMPDGKRYFSRTLLDYGPMRKIQGSSDWREFELPFNLMEHKPESVTLEINVVMPGKGTIELSELTVSDVQTASYHLWFPFIFSGGIFVVAVFLSLFLWQKNTRRQAELRRMQALDA